MFSLFSKTGIATVLFALLLIAGVYLTAAKMSGSDMNPPEPAATLAPG
ncbi:hypothetical protein A33M_2754 [Rhodovulum sp. PH10]|nr:hypothetical protein [Rhodovulum sp. PH10]EJW11771.1 hypothetical protein A33M_2754 [Rhodovulum sp. PH10]